MSNIDQEMESPNKSRRINIDLGFIYSISIFFCFFIQGGFSRVYWFSIVVFALIYFSVKKINIAIELDNKRIFISLLCLLAFAILNKENLSNSLAGDHWYHLQTAYIIPLKLLPALSKIFPNLAVSFVLWVYSCAISIFTILMYVLYKKNKNFYIVLLVAIGLIITCIFYSMGISNNDAHPPLRVYPITLLGALGLQSLVFRLQGLIPLFLLTYWALEMLSDKRQKIIFLGFLYTLPVLFFNTLLVEFSIWTFSILTIYFLTIIKAPRLSEEQIVSFAVAFTLIGLVRQTAVFGLVLLFFHCILTKNTRPIFKLALISLPAVFQIIKSAIHGTPATYDPSELFLDLPNNLSLLERLVLSMKDQTVSQLLATSGVPSMLLVLFLLFFLGIKKQFKQIAIFVTAFVLFWILFHMIRPILWGVPRYQLEYIAPLVIVGFFTLQVKFINRLILIPMFFIITNIVSIIIAYQDMPTYKIDYPQYFTGETPYISELIFNIDEAIGSTYHKCNGTFNIGDSNGTNFPLIFAGAKSEKFIKSVEAVNSDKDKSDVCVIEMLEGFKSGAYYNSVRNTSVTVQLKGISL